MEKERANRIIIALIELTSVAEGINGLNRYPYFDRLEKLLSSPDYQELKNWLAGKK